MQKENLLDKRGYCALTSMCFYSLGVPNYKLTYPPKTYPSTASYSSLTNHFKALVKDGLMHRVIIKAILYPEFHRRISMENVRLRRYLRRTSLRRRQSICSSTDLSQQESESNDECGTSAASSIGFVRYCPNKNSKQSTDSQGTMIDHGPGIEADCTRDIFANADKCNLGRVPVIRDSDGSIMFTHAVDCDIGSRDSLQYYSKPVRVVIDRRQTTTVNSVVHTATAQMFIGSKPNDKEDTSDISKGSPSNESELSSFNQRPFLKNMACENLLNLDDSMAIKSDKNKKCPTIDERHSMPPLFVGNRFNCSSLTEVFIPSYREKMELKYAENASEGSEDDENDNDNDKRNSNASTATHSSSIDIAPVMPAPDQLSVELLYNPTNRGSVIKPPSMFGVNKTLSKEMDLRSTPLDIRKSQNEVKRCTSSQMINLQNVLNNQRNKGDNKSPKLMKKCGCCTESPCVSQRSSDSGMAGSYTIQLTPETPVPNAHSGFDQNEQILPDIEQRLNGLVHSQSSHNFGHFDNIPFADSNHDSGQYGCTESESEPNRDSAAAKNMFELSSSQDTVRRKSRCQSVEPQPETNVDTNTTAKGLYRTGLYAHWWKKEQLPAGILNDIYRLKQNRQSNSMTNETADSRGSGKINCLSFHRQCVWH